MLDKIKTPPANTASNLSFGQLKFTVDKNYNKDAGYLLEKIKSDNGLEKSPVRDSLEIQPQFTDVEVKDGQTMRGGQEFTIKATKDKEDFIKGLFNKLGINVVQTEPKTETVEEKIKNAVTELAKRLDLIKQLEEPLPAAKLYDTKFKSEQIEEKYGVKPEDVGLVVSSLGNVYYGPEFEKLKEKYVPKPGTRRVVA